MKLQPSVALVLGLVLGLAIPLLARSQAAQGQRDEVKQAWEYKIVLTALGSDVEKYSDRMTQQYNSLAKDGWEYMGPVFEQTSTAVNGSYAGTTGAYVAFRKPAK